MSILTRVSTRRPVGLAAVVRKEQARSYPPVAANQPKVDEPTNTMGAMHGWGRLTVALMSEFPAVLAGNGAATITNVSTAAFPASTAGNSDINATVSLPHPCIAPIVFVGSSTFGWFAATGG